MNGSYVHLHNHSTYSMLDGAAQLDELVAEAKRLGMPAVAVTDHGNMFGSYEFFQAAKAAGIKPIVGIEAYAAPQSRHHKKPVYWGESDQRGDDVSGNGAYTHITLLAETPQGLRNLFRLSSLASIEGGYYKPRADRELLAEYSAGVIATTGCPSGEVQTRLRLGHEREALQAAADFRDIFGAENYLLELMDHGLDIERKTREGLLEIGRKLSLSPVATNDCHYVTRDQAKAHDALLCVQVGKTLDDPKRFKFDGDGYYLKSAAEMRTLFDAEACDTTLAIAERIQPYDEVFAQVDRKPRVPLEPGDTEDAALYRAVCRGANLRFPEGLPDGYGERIDTELAIIKGQGFAGYFLVTVDLVRWAQDRGIYCRGRGSSAGSLVVYLLGVTDIDPMVHNLFFERFLNPDRISPPDIDIDVEGHRRGEMVRYLTEQWGSENVASVITFSTIKTKAAIRDAARVLGHPYAAGDKLTNALPPAIHAEDASLSAITDPTHERYNECTEIRTLVVSDPQSTEIVATARGLEGLIRNAGVHACGVFLSSEPLIDVIPLWMRQEDEAIVTGWDWSTCERVGLLKLDVLGSATLTVMTDTIAAVKSSRGIDIDLTALKLDDPATYELLSSGHTLGVFQMESAGMRELLHRIQPTCFADVCAATALYRPGPMGTDTHNEYADRKNGNSSITPIHPELANALEDVLSDTYGLCTYQEDVMAIARKVAGYTLSQADLLRRAMGKKKPEILAAEFTRFRDGMTTNGFSLEAIRTLWDILTPFSAYGFVKSHAASYGLVSYWTAYLKAHYPAEFMSARLSSVADKPLRTAIYLSECRRMGVKILSPDVNGSDLNFTSTTDGVRFGLGTVRNIGEGPVASIVATRNTHGPFESFTDFLAKVPSGVCNKRVISSLIKAGAFDSLGHRRQALYETHSSAVDYALEEKRQDAIGQVDLFGDLTVEPPPEGPEWPRDVLLAFEREMLGLYVSDHPLSGVDLRRHAARDIATILAAELAQDAPVTIAGLITTVTRKTTKAGKRMAVVSIEDLDATMEVLVFPREYEELSGLLAVDAVVAVKGHINRRDDAVSVVATDMFPLDAVPTVAPVTLTIPAISVTRDLMDRLKVVCVEHKGAAELRIELTGHVTTVLVAEGYPVDPCPEFKAKLKTILEDLP